MRVRRRVTGVSDVVLSTRLFITRVIQQKGDRSEHINNWDLRSSTGPKAADERN